jgi:hypothetical protein
VAKDRRKIWLAAGILFFVIYFFAAARPIPLETVLIPRWLSSLESEHPVPLNEPSQGGSSGALEEPVPFTLGGRFGYVDYRGQFLINRIKKGEVSLSKSLWAEYEAEPERITVFDRQGDAALVIDQPHGYPFFLDDRIFTLGNEQNALSEIDRSGAVLWEYEFAAPLTCVDAAAGLTLSGSIDGVVEVLDSDGTLIFGFEPGGSRYPVILGCAMSRDGSRIGIISGIDNQRFLLLERFGSGAGEYKVIYHEFLEEGFRRPVHIFFIESDRWLVFERQGGLGIYEINARRGRKIPLDGKIAAIDSSGGDGIFFVAASHPGGRNELTGIKLPGRIIMKAPFKSNSVFLARRGQRLLTGGGLTLASFELEKM